MVLNLDFDMLVVFDRRYSLAEFRRASKAMPNSYAEELVQRIHSCLFEYPRDVYEEYVAYYAIEYADFAQFLYWKYELDSNVVQKIVDKMAGERMYIGYGRDSIGLFEDETFMSVLNDILSELGEGRDEDTN
jgi:hypothetical protein